MVTLSNGRGVSFEELRNAFGLSRQELANLLGTRLRIIYRLENNQPLRSADYSQYKAMLDAWSDILLNLDELFELENIKKWVNISNGALGDLTPKEYIKRPGGVLDLANILKSFGR